MGKGNIGFVFQSFNLIDELNVFENIELPLTYLKIPADERNRRVNEIMQRMNISHRAKHYPQQLSGGQQHQGKYHGQNDTDCSFPFSINSFHLSIQI